MKTKMLMLFPILILVMACSNSKDSTSSNTTTTAHQYGLVSGSCYDYTSSSYVAPTYCATSTSGTYYLSGGNCYLSTTNQIVSTSYCGTTTTSTAGQCYGSYIFNSYGYMQPVTCAGTNCRGYTLIESSSGRQVTCQ